MKRFIIIKTQFEGIHNWPDCNVPGVAFLKYPHRHIFHVCIKVEVKHNDRQIEIINLKRSVDDYIQSHLGYNLGTKSCEDIAEDLFMEFFADYVSVLEDNENGAEVHQ